MKGLNVLEMIDACESNAFTHYPLFIQRESWAPTTVVEVMGASKDWKDWPGGPPYFGTPSPLVYGWLFSRGEYKLIEVSCPGTSGYKRVDEPVWWFPPAIGEVVLSDGLIVSIE